MSRRQDRPIKLRRQMGLLTLVLVLAVTNACSRQLGFLSSSLNSPSGQQLPFAHLPEKGGMSPTLPFASSAIPEGAAIVVRLQSPISSRNARSGDVFTAVLEEPVVVEGQIMAPRGVSVTGRVAVAHPGGLDDAGYLRLTLTSVVISGAMLPVHTSSIFAKGSSREREVAIATGNMSEAQFSTDRRLTFRLLEPIPLGDLAAPEKATTH